MTQDYRSNQRPPNPIPEDWSPEQAFAVAEFCDRLYLALWSLYGYEMADLLNETPETQTSVRRPLRPIPVSWTPEQALTVADFCDQLNTLIWDAYDEPIADYLDARRGRTVPRATPWQPELPFPTRSAWLPERAPIDEDEYDDIYF